MMMKKLLVFALVVIAFASCNKKDQEQYCWKCYWTETTTDKQGTATTTPDSVSYCDMTDQEIEVLENRYKGRVYLDTTTSDMQCVKTTY